MDGVAVRILKRRAGTAVIALGLSAGLYAAWGLKVSALLQKPADPLSLEAFTSTATFSEVESARATLTAEVSRQLARLREKYNAAIQQTETFSEARRRLQQEWAGILRTKIHEFKGTAQEFQVLQEFFLIARMGNLQTEWLDEYLRVIYEAPGQGIIGQSINDALTIALELGREGELGRALRHLLQVPLELETKNQVELALQEFPQRNRLHLTSVRGSHRLQPAWLAKDCLL